MSQFLRTSLSRRWANLKVGLTLADKRRLALYALGGTFCGTGLVVAFFAYDCESMVYDGILLPVLRHLDPETAERFCLKAAKWGLCPFDVSGDIGRTEKTLAIGVCGMMFSSPIGIAAGVDRDGEAFRSLMRIGVSHVEVGSITPKPQEGPAAPRRWLLEADDGTAYRPGTPSDGLRNVVTRLRSGLGKLRGGVLGVNLAPNADSLDLAADFVRGVSTAGRVADYLVLNLSACDWGQLGTEAQLRDVLQAARKARDALERHDWLPPLLVKISPDLPVRHQLQVALAVAQLELDGIVVGGGTAHHPTSFESPPPAPDALLCGHLCAEPTRECIANLYRFTRGHIPIVAAGGILSSLDAYRAIRAGACLVQLHSALALQGPGVVPRMRRNLWKRVREDGFHQVGDCIGLDTPLPFAPPPAPLWRRWLPWR